MSSWLQAAKMSEGCRLLGAFGRLLCWLCAIRTGMLAILWVGIHDCLVFGMKGVLAMNYVLSTRYLIGRNGHSQ